MIAIKYLVILAVFATALTINTTLSKTPKEIDRFDVGLYHPEALGLKDLTFEVRVKNLAKKLNAMKSMGTIKDVVFKVYWSFPRNIAIDIKGLPGGFEEIKQQLKALVLNRFDFIVPSKLSKKIQGYSFKRTTSKKRMVVLTGKDTTNSKDAHKIVLKFGRDGSLNTYQQFTSAGVGTSTMDFKKTKWSKNKWVLEKMSVKTILGIQVTSMENNFDYIKIGGFGLPRTISTHTTQELARNNQKTKSKSISGALVFSKYKVNTGEARKFFRKLNKQLRKLKKRKIKGKGR